MNRESFPIPNSQHLAVKSLLPPQRLNNIQFGRNPSTLDDRYLGRQAATDLKTPETTTGTQDGRKSQSVSGVGIK